MGSIEMAMMNASAIQLAKLYNLPIYASAGVTEAKRPDIQAGFEKTVSTLTVAMTGADYIHLAAGMLDSANSISYEQYVIDNEIIGMIKRMLAGITVTDDTMAFEVITNVGPGGNFVTEEHTIDHMVSEFYYPNLSVRCNFDLWEEKGRPDMLTRAKSLVRETLGDKTEGLLDHAAISEIKRAFPGSRLI
jgi:trimethylamine--corrinoid protein Co-methyltransferase